MCRKKSSHRQLALTLADTISVASRLGKIARNAVGRRLAYKVKGTKISHALLNFGEYFKVVGAERNPHLGLLLLVRLPTGRGAHIPMMALSPAAQGLVHATVVNLLEGGKCAEAA
jgi:hypothetical protein